MNRIPVVAVALLMTAGSVIAAEIPMGEPGWVAGPATHASAPSDPTASTPNPEEWGASSLTAVNYAAIGWSPLNDGQWNHFGNSGWSFKQAGGNTGTCIAVNLPSGALLEGITTYTNDADAVGTINAVFFANNLVTNTGTEPLNIVAAAGIQRIFRALTPPLTINNDRRAYSMCYFHSVAGSTLQNAGATFWYRLQVSPAPAVATFPGDVPTTHPLFRFVEAMAASGLTGGCAPGAFCPDSPVTRGQMAVFLSVALGLHFPN